jgi:hypothetical protein
MARFERGRGSGRDPGQPAQRVTPSERCHCTPSGGETGDRREDGRLAPRRRGRAVSRHSPLERMPCPAQTRTPGGGAGGAPKRAGAAACLVAADGRSRPAEASGPPGAVAASRTP